MKELLKNYSCVIVKSGEVIHSVNGKGIRPLLDLYRNNKSDLFESYVADKVIGKAAASFLVCAKVKEVYGEIMSKYALELLNRYEIKTEYGTLVDEIRNMTNTGMCPIENLVKDINNPEDAVNAVVQHLL